MTCGFYRPLAAALCASALALALQAAPPSPTEASAPSPAEIAASVAVIHAPGAGIAPENLDLDALKVAIDSESGKVRPVTPEESRRLGSKLGDRERTMLSRSADGLRSVKGTDGSLRLDLEGRFLSLSTARMDRDGKLHGLCVDSLDEASDHLHGVQEVSDVE